MAVHTNQFMIKPGIQQQLTYKISENILSQFLKSMEIAEYRLARINCL